MPDKASMSIVGIEDEKYKQDKVEWWNRVHGFDMSNIRDLAMAEPLVDSVDNDQIITDHCEFLVHIFPSSSSSSSSSSSLLLLS